MHVGCQTGIRSYQSSRLGGISPALAIAGFRLQQAAHVNGLGTRPQRQARDQEILKGQHVIADQVLRELGIACLLAGNSLQASSWASCGICWRNLPIAPS